MSIRAFRRLTRSERREIIDSIDHPAAQWVMRLAFLGPGKRSWAKVSCLTGGMFSPDAARKLVTRALAKV